MARRFNDIEPKYNEYEDVIRESLEESADGDKGVSSGGGYRSDDPAMIYLKEMGARKRGNNKGYFYNALRDREDIGIFSPAQEQRSQDKRLYPDG
jgi:hypothetical protein